MSTPWLDFRGVTVGYPGLPVLKDLTLTIPSGQALGLVGPNGSGKTTLLKTMLGLLPPLAGELLRPGDGRLRIGYVPQAGNCDELFPFTVLEMVEMGLAGLHPPWAGPSDALRSQAGEALAAVGLDTHGSRLYRELSGGQKQRVLVARALASRPDVLVLDEPTRGLDLGQATALLRLLDRLCQEREMTMVLVSHVLTDVLEHTRFLLLLHDGALAYHGPVAGFTAAHLRTLYGPDVPLLEGMGA